MIKNISNLGDAALYCDFGTEVNKEVNNKVIRYFKSIQKENIDGINNLTPSYNKLIVSFDLRKKNFQNIKKLIENLNVINDGGWHFTNLKTPEEMYEKFMNFGHHDEFRLSGITVEKIREKIANKEMFYDHFADKSSTNKWESDYKLKLLNEKMLPKFLIENKNKYIEWFSN